MRNWQPAHTAPDDGAEFYFLIRGDDTVHTGTACPHGTTVWHPKAPTDSRPPEPPYGGLCVP